MIIEFISNNHPQLVCIQIFSSLQYNYEDNDLNDFLYDYYAHNVDIHVDYNHCLLHQADHVINHYDQLVKRLQNFDNIYLLLQACKIHDDIISNCIFHMLEF